MNTPMYFIQPRKDYNERPDFERGITKKRFYSDEASMLALKALWTSNGSWNPYDAVPIDMIHVDFGGMASALEPIVFVHTPDVCLRIPILFVGELLGRLDRRMPQVDLPTVVLVPGFHKHYLFSIAARDRLLPELKCLHAACESLIDYTIHKDALVMEELNRERPTIVKMPRPT